MKKVNEILNSELKEVKPSEKEIEKKNKGKQL